MKGTKEKARILQERVWKYYKEHARPMPWRFEKDPYKVFVSEVMLQQTQVARVESKYHEFIQRFPTIETLAQASLGEVLTVWSGLGYNRRGKFLHQSAQQIVDLYKGRVPREVEVLETLPGIGSATARSIVAFAYNIPFVFIETNIRSAVIHTCFSRKSAVSDREVHAVLESALDIENPREWYYALMDYGVMLKRKYGNPSRRSVHHVVQKPFKGSKREVRGYVLRQLQEERGKTFKTLLTGSGFQEEVLRGVLYDLKKEGMILVRGTKYVLP